MELCSGKTERVVKTTKDKDVGLDIMISLNHRTTIMNHNHLIPRLVLFCYPELECVKVEKRCKDIVLAIPIQYQSDWKPQVLITSIKLLN